MPLPEQTQVRPVVDVTQGEQHYIHATIRVQIPAKKRNEALVILGSMIEQTKIEEGCLSCRLYQDVQEEGMIMLEASWAGEEFLRRHLASDQFHTVLLVIEMAVRPPEIRFATVSQVTGLETIEKARIFCA